MFNTLTLKELKLLLKELREYHSIKNYSKMKKPELVEALSARFNMVSGNLYLREDVRPAKQPKIEPKELETILKKYLRALTTDELISLVGKHFWLRKGMSTPLSASTQADTIYS